jgi:acyl carrier protein
MIPAPKMSPITLSEPEVARALVDFVNANIMASGHAITVNTSFETAGVDSMALLQILLFTETKYGFWVPDEDLSAENTGSAQALARYICRRKASP